jgi:hypothetical protein
VQRKATTRDGGARTIRRTAVSLILASGTLLVAACGSSTGGNAIRNSTTTAPLATTSTTTVAQAQAAVLADWRAAEEAAVTAAKDPTGPGVLLLSGYFVDPQLSFLTNQYEKRAHDGIIDIGTLDLGQPRVESMTATQAVVVSCETDALMVIFKATGKPLAGIAGKGPMPAGIRATLALAPSGVWKISESNGTEGSCVGF